MWVLFLLPLTTAWFYGRDEPDRWTTGGVFPLPQTIVYGKSNRTIHPTRVGFDLLDKSNCDILKINAENYLNKWMFPFPITPKGSAEDFVVSVKVRQACPPGPPTADSSEEYKLRVSIQNASIRAETVWGAVRAMETLSQLIFLNEKKSKYLIRTVDISDAPRFPVRGLMLDSARHFLSPKVLKRQLDLMAMNKMNVFHWHLVDDEAFPFESKKFPELSGVGAYSPRHVYSRETVKEIIDYARIRGIRVIPEFDLPGHTNSWRGISGLLTECFDEKGKPTYPNLFNPTNEANFEFLKEFLDEITEVFPDEYIHMGGDEVVDYLADCWDRNEQIKKFMKEKGFANNTMLENYFFERLNEIFAQIPRKRKQIFWQEVFDNNKPDRDATIHIWKGNSHEEIVDQVKNVTAAGHPAIVSACWYLNYIKYGADWRANITNYVPSNSMYYYCDPAAFEGTEEQKKLVLGGIVAMWGEFVDNTNVESRTWPRASAASERLWSPAEKTKEASDAWPRLHELRCRLVARGYRVQSNNFPDYCPFEFDGDN